MSEDVELGSHRATPVGRSTPLARRIIIYAGVLLFGFLLGFVPMWLQSRTSDASLADAERRLTLSMLQGDLSSAAIDARRAAPRLRGGARRPAGRRESAHHREPERGREHHPPGEPNHLA